MTNYGNIFILDTEATTASPMTGLMTEFGIVHMMSGLSFYGKLYDFTPHPDIPALPVVTNPQSSTYFRAEFRPSDPYIPGSELYELDMCGLHDLAREVSSWVTQTCPHGQRPIMVSDNPGFDNMWFTCFLDSQEVSNPFGFSSRRIGDFYAGTKGDWRRSSDWKKLRKTAHTHNPVDDARGNAEALRIILGIHNDD